MTNFPRVTPMIRGLSDCPNHHHHPSSPCRSAGLQTPADLAANVVPGAAQRCSRFATIHQQQTPLLGCASGVVIAGWLCCILPLPPSCRIACLPRRLCPSVRRQHVRAVLRRATHTHNSRQPNLQLQTRPSIASSPWSLFHPRAESNVSVASALLLVNQDNGSSHIPSPSHMWHGPCSCPLETSAKCLSALRQASMQLSRRRLHLSWRFYTRAKSVIDIVAFP